MDLDRPHFRTTSPGNSSIKTAANATSDLLISFTSRLSSSTSMKLTKSIISPGRAASDGGPVSLSSSISRRLRTNGSLKGGQASPFFTTPGKKRGCAFENPEPSSPKVTCIGQVRVKTRKKMEQTRSLSRRRSAEVSFRRPEKAADGGNQTEGYKICAQNSNISGHYQHQQSQECLSHRNQRWVHLPISVCEALRAIGAEFSCLFPCKSSCFSTSERKKAEKQNGSSASEKGHSSCGAVFARWLVSVNNGEGGKRREIELVVAGGLEEQREERMSMRSSRRHFFEDIEVNDDRIEVKEQSVEREEETARVSICIPPKNALLLMRCRSDPIKMAALGHRFSWDAQAAPKDEDIKEEINEVNENLEEKVTAQEGKEKVTAQEGKDSEIEVFMVKEVEVDEVLKENEANLEMKVGDHGTGEENQEGKHPVGCEEMVAEKVQDELQQEMLANEHTFVEEEVEVESNMSSFEALLDQEIAGHYEDSPPIQDKEEIEEIPLCFVSPPAESDEEENASIEVPPFHEEAEMGRQEEEIVKPINSEEEATFEDTKEKNQWSHHPKFKAEIPEITHQEYYKEDQPTVIQLTEYKTEGPENQEPKKVKEHGVLPECLLLMMREPKLSMEVSKETWVCSTDFIRFLPERPPKAAVKATKRVGCIHESMKRMLSNESKSKPITPAPPPENDLQNHSHLQQQPRSSCSLPTAAASMATMIENKLVNAVAYEPFVLTRCKSEPVKTAAAKFMPESCFWNNTIRKLEPHRQATVGVGAAGIGF